MHYSPLVRIVAVAILSVNFLIPLCARPETDRPFAQATSRKYAFPAELRGKAKELCIDRDGIVYIRTILGVARLTGEQLALDPHRPQGRARMRHRQRRRTRSQTWSRLRPALVLLRVLVRVRVAMTARSRGRMLQAAATCPAHPADLDFPEPGLGRPEARITPSRRGGQGTRVWPRVGGSHRASIARDRLDPGRRCTTTMARLRPLLARSTTARSSLSRSAMCLAIRPGMFVGTAGMACASPTCDPAQRDGPHAIVRRGLERRSIHDAGHSSQVA